MKYIRRKLVLVLIIVEKGFNKTKNFKMNSKWTLVVAALACIGKFLRH